MSTIEQIMHYLLLPAVIIWFLYILIRGSKNGYRGRSIVTGGSKGSNGWRNIVTKKTKHENNNHS